MPQCVDSSHGNFESKEALALHMQQSHQDMLPNPEFVASIKSIEQGVNPEPIRKVSETLDMGSAPTGPTVYTPQTMPHTLPDLPATPQVPIESVKLDPRPIYLTYKFEGDCKKCFSPVETLTLELHDDNKNKKMHMVAWCNNCRLQLANKKVTPV